MLKSSRAAFLIKPIRAYIMDDKRVVPYRKRRLHDHQCIWFNSSCCSQKGTFQQSQIFLKFLLFHTCMSPISSLPCILFLLKPYLPLTLNFFRPITTRFMILIRSQTCNILTWHKLCFNLHML